MERGLSRSTLSRAAFPVQSRPGAPARAHATFIVSR
jgi:hypothetical protein